MIHVPFSGDGVLQFFALMATGHIPLGLFIIIVEWTLQVALLHYSDGGETVLDKCGGGVIDEAACAKGL